VSLGVSPLFLAPYALTVVASAFAGYKYTKKSLFFWRDAATGSIFVKGGVAIFAIYIAAMLARITISLLLVGTGFSSFFANPTSQHAAFSSSTYYASVTTDFLMMFGAGLFIGRNLRLYNRYSMIRRGEESVSEA
jgi:nitrate reductase gamma subunit